jgi:hypothetical protein
MFDEALLKSWCQLYKQFIINDGQHLANIINSEPAQSLHSYLMVAVDLKIINELLKESEFENSDYLNAYGQLRALEAKFKHPLNSPIVSSDTCYMLVYSEQHPIIKAIPDNLRFQADKDIGNDAILDLRYQWVNIGRSQLSFNHSDVFDGLEKTLKIALSPIASYQDMHWQHKDKHFWCSGVKDEQALESRIIEVLKLAYQHGVGMLLFPELVMTENLQQKISDWLKKYNAFEPVICLVIAGTRHVFIGHEKYANRCTVLNFIGDVLWEQDKSQRFELTADIAQALLNADSAVFEPSHFAEKFVMCRTKLGRIATPICLDFIKAEGLWQKLAIDIFLVPAMSSGLSRFELSSKLAGNRWGSAVFVCNTKPDDTKPDYDKNAVHVYLPQKKTKEPDKLSSYLFTIDIDIAMN